MYLIIWGKFYSDGVPHSFAKNKQDAVKALQKLGFKYCKKQDLFLLNNENLWAKIEKIDNILNIVEIDS